MRNDQQEISGDITEVVLEREAEMIWRKSRIAATGRHEDASKGRTWKKKDDGDCAIDVCLIDEDAIPEEE